MTDGEIAKLLNPEQGDAVKMINGPVLVLAGAGTGKTRVITFRIAHMIDEGIDPKNILGMTFTNKAAREMKERLTSLVAPEKAQNVTIGTFHSFCGKFLRKEIKRLHYLPNFSIIDDSDQNGLIRQAAAALGYAKNEVPVPLVKNYISNMKNQLCFPKQAKKLADHDENHDKLRFSRVYAEYQNLLETQNMVDFDDMLLLVYEIFEKFPEVLKKYQDIYKYLLVDEYQDTNDVQFAIIEQLTKEHQNLCVVGDDDQSIYGWRGANIDNILNFDKKYPDVKAVKLEQNYRSTSKILKAANFVIGKNAKRHSKNLWSAQGEGENLLVVKTSDAEVEADFIADYIAQIMGDQAERSYDDFAILYRSNHLSRQIELALRKAAIPYRMVGGQEFFKRKEIKDAVAYLKILANPKDDQSLLRVLNLPPRGLGKKVVDTLKKYKAASFQPFTKLIGEDICLKQFTSKAAKSAGDFYNALAKYRGIFSNSGDIALKVKDFLTDIGYLNGLQRIYKDHAESLKRRENVYEFISAIAEYEKKCASPVSLQDYLESYALMEENDKVEEASENSSAVTLTTIHAAKGLEYPYILQMAMESNIFPHHRSITEGTLDEELRLFYVSLTRAKEQLVISYSISRMDKGVERNQFPSEFIKYLPEDIVDVSTPEDLIKTMGKDDMNKSFAGIMAMLNN
ncbi:MAG: UvrD-helicase domain-containing protein [Victivallales bacterium]|nr:UvrD-helicase domain-containing protein [Victivallales bacterium]